MRTVLLASLRTHARRYAAALLAVVLGAAFIVVTAGLSSSVRSGLVAGIEEPYDGADAVLDMPTAEDAADLLAAAPANDAEAWLIGWTRQPIASGSRVLSPEADVAQVADAPERRWQDLVEGRYPAAPGEALVDANEAESNGVGLGDRLRIGSGTDALEVEVVGTADSPSVFATAAVYLLWPDLQRWEDSLYVSSLAWSAGGDHDRAAAQIRDVVPYAEPLTVTAFVDRVHTEVNNEVDVVSVMVLLFAAIALVVAILVVANTFSILFAQRTRELALLRCVGATRRQLVRSVRAEALAIGVLAAALGVGLGVVAAHGLVAAVDARWPQAGLGAPSFGWPWLAGAAATAILVTVVAAWLPTRRVLGIGPLAALGPDDGTGVRTRTGRVRLAVGTLALVAGTVGLVAAVGAGSAPVMVVGGILVFGGVLLWGPVLVPALIRLVLRLGGRALGPAGRLAGGNAVRNPRRTAATTASLLIGVTLTTAVLTGLASSRTAVAAEMDRSHPIDLTLTAGTGSSLSAETVRRAEELDGVRAAVPVPGVGATLGGDLRLPLLAPAATGSDSVAPVLDGRQLDLPGPRTILVAWDMLDGPVQDGDRVVVRTPEGTTRLTVAGGDGFGEAALVAPAVLDELAPGAGATALWLRAEEGADAEALGAQVESLATPVAGAVTNDLVQRGYVDLQLDVLTAGVVGLLGIAVLIALVGIGNTLGLSVAERAREHALLRALGLTRGQLRRMLAGEATLLSVVATMLGTTIGVAFAWVGMRTLVAPVVDEASLSLPWGQLTAMLAVSAVAGVLAAVLPARRAARTLPAAGLAAD